MEEKNFFEQPLVEVESSSGTREISLLTNDLKHRIIHIDGTIDERSVNSFVRQMNYMCETDEPIKIMINSGGGSVNQGLVIYDIIQGCKNQIDIYCTGMAASMAAILLASGAKGHRHILKNSQVMIHEPLIAGGVGGSASSIKNTSDSINATKNQLIEILHEHTGKSIKAIRKAISYDNYMDAKQAIEFGLVDDIKGIWEE